MVTERLDEKRLKDSMALYQGPFVGSIGFEDVVDDVEHYFSGGGDLPAISYVDGICRRIGIDSLTHFGYWVLEAGELRKPSLSLFQRSAFLGFLTQKLEFEANPEYLTPRFAAYGEALLQLIATNQTALIGPTEAIALDVLKSGRYEAPKGTTGYFVKPSKIGVFALEMLAAMRNETIDWESFHVPPDRFWLDCARTGLTEPDPAKAAEWATQLCQAHMQTLQTDKENFSYDDATGHEIDFEAHFLWPITVHAFLRLRGQLGLQTGDIDHPLMRTSFAILKDSDIPADAWEPEPWFTEILDKVVSVAPDLASSVALIR